MVSKTDLLDRKAIASARQYMGMVAWPTIILALVLGASYIATVVMALSGLLSL
jgi:beta-carotene hydroxylase